MHFNHDLRPTGLSDTSFLSSTQQASEQFVGKSSTVAADWSVGPQGEGHKHKRSD